MATRNGTPGNDVLTGTQFNDSIFGLAGNDSLLGLGGNDRLDGGGGNDNLDGGIGIDTLIGGTGNDTYIVDNDIITEAASSGTDTVRSSVSYTLGNNLENLTLTGSALNGTGNNLNNIIIGNANDNILKGLAGKDNLNGKAGNDDLLASSGAVGERDTLTGGAGRDTFFLGNATQVFYDDRNRATTGRGDYALITDFNKGEDLIKLNGRNTDYRLAASPSGLPTGTAIYRNKPTSEPDELIAIIRGSSGLSLNGNYFRFTADEITLSSLNGRNGFKINGIAGGLSGSSVSNAGDVNGDGFDDIIIGAPGAGASAGSSYIVFGKAGGVDASLDLSALNGSNGFALNGGSLHDFSGSSVSSAGDVNGDGFDDIIIGAPDVFGDNFYDGESYVIFGKAGGFDRSFNLSNLDGSNGFAISGDRSDTLGRSVSSAGDINGDGFDDLIIGAPYISRVQDLTGKSYVVFGKAGSFSPRLDVTALGSNGFGIFSQGEFEDVDLGYSVSSAGDVNGDGFDDLIIGDPSIGPLGDYGYSSNEAGKSYVFFGKAEGLDAGVNVSELNGSNGFAIVGINAYDRSGVAVSNAGDINGDGLDDIIIGASGADPNGQGRAGESYVVFGKREGFGASLNLSTLNGSNGFKINGIDSGDSLGVSVSTVGDINSDGFDDLIVGASGADPNGQESAGESYVVFGKAGGFSSSFNLSKINSSNGFVINGIDPDDKSGGSVSSAEDVNGDGFDDIIMGARGADPNGQESAGESYVIFGRDFTNKVTHRGTAGNDTLTGTAGDDILVGGLGNDKLIGGLGIDVLYGGAGNDTLSFGAIDRRFNGGSGTDTLRIDTSGINADLTAIANNKITEFEIIDITGTGNNSLKFTRLDVLDLSDTTNRLIVKGNAGDAVTSTGQGWLFGGTTTVDSILYKQYTAGAATLLVDTDITQTIT